MSPLKRWLPILAALLAAVPAVAQPAPTTAPARRPSAAGGIADLFTASRAQRKTYDFKEAGKEMEYGLILPARYDKATKWPLVIALHGLGSNPMQILRYPGMTALADRHGFIIAAPMGYNSRGWYGARILVRGQPDDPKNLSELSEKDVMNVLEIVRKDYSIDPDRIYLMGHSMGGGGTWHLAIKYPNLWAAIGPIAPAPVVLPNQAEKIKSLPVILVQGAQDTLVKPEWTRPWADQMKRLGMTYEYVELPTADHLSAAFQGLPKVFDFFDKHPRNGKPNPQPR